MPASRLGAAIASWSVGASTSSSRLPAPVLTSAIVASGQLPERISPEAARLPLRLSAIPCYPEALRLENGHSCEPYGRLAMPDTVVITVDSRACKKCGICVEFCPKAVLESGPLGEVLVVKPEACSQCRLCELRCPDLAIVVTVPARSTEPAGTAAKGEGS